MPHSNAVWKMRDGTEVLVSEMTTAHLTNACCLLCRAGSRLLIEDLAEVAGISVEAAEAASYSLEAESRDSMKCSYNPLSSWHRLVKDRPVGRAMLVELRRREEPFTYRFWPDMRTNALPRWSDNFYPEWTLNGEY